MSLVALPPEILYDIVDYLSWQDTVPLLSTTKAITENHLPRESVERLREAKRMITWETSERVKRGWPLERYHLLENSVNYPEHLSGRFIQDPEINSYWPCYTCLRQQTGKYFTTGMKCRYYSLGQKDALKRKCIQCGVRTGFYKPGCLAEYSVCICARCELPMEKWQGRKLKSQPFNIDDWFDKNLVETPNPYNINPLPLQPGFEATSFGRNFVILDGKALDGWWWCYCSECVDCAVESGYTAHELFSPEAAHARWVARTKRNYKNKMLVRLQRRRDNGRKIRADLGLPEPDGLLDLEALKLSDDPFPKWQRTPSVWEIEYNLYRRELRAGLRSREHARRLAGFVKEKGNKTA